MLRNLLQNRRVGRPATVRRKRFPALPRPIVEQFGDRRTHVTVTRASRQPMPGDVDSVRLADSVAVAVDDAHIQVAVVEVLGISPPMLGRPAAIAG